MTEISINRSVPLPMASLSGPIRWMDVGLNEFVTKRRMVEKKASLDLILVKYFKDFSNLW